MDMDNESLETVNESIETKTLFEIAHSSEVLSQAIDKVQEAYNLINSDPIAREYIKFNSSLIWKQKVWDILQKEYDKAKPGNKDVYFLRAFDFFGVALGVNIGDGDTVSSS
jgi:hypothetical protein